MKFIPDNPLLDFHADTLQYIRKQCDLDKPEKLKDTIDTFYEWIQKREHFLKKDYSKEYLERSIVASNGSLEEAKKRLDIISTFKTLLPKYFEPFDINNSYILKIVDCCLLPKMTHDYTRVFMLKNRGQRYDSGVLDFFKYLIMLSEYASAHDYAAGICAVYDYTENNVKELIKNMNFLELQQTITTVLEGYNVKVTGVHFLTQSEYIEIFIGLLKNVLSPKIGGLIQVHRRVETIHKYICKDILPIDYGGKEKSLKELSANTKEVIKSKEFTKYFNEMKRAGTNEALRRNDTRIETYVGMPGSLKTLCID